ncbi:reverse transcriptase [Plakobranchus ocellatus]|uniref:Reverse transcriptase n=1 Tax=Plakobranchus ocellatus TaxID=259542 RepID=A0AAV3Y4D1_9GAST|nr:reverse transcriptase [Plakobranchus ocellatus]
MLEDYFNTFKMRFSTERFSTDSINLKVGIARDCTISLILFVLAIEFIPRAAEGNASPADFCGGYFMSPLKAFVDDTTILYSKENELA